MGSFETSSQLDYSSEENASDEELWLHYDESFNPSTEHLSSYPEIFQTCFTALYKEHPGISLQQVNDQLGSICHYCPDYYNVSEAELYQDETCLFVSYKPMPVFWLMFSLIFVCGALGNLLTLTAGISARKKFSALSAMFLFISNLAAGDFLMAVLCVPATFVSVVWLKWWPFGEVLCVAVSYLQVSLD